MKFKSEEELYRFVSEAFGEVQNIVRHHEILGPLVNNRRMVYTEKRFDGQTVYFVGEVHLSKRPVDHAHEVLVPRISSAPRNWLFLRENARHPITDPLSGPGQFYFQELARLFGITDREALVDLYSPTTRAYIRKRSGISEEDIDRALLTYDIYVHESDEEIEKLLDPKEAAQFIRYMSEALRKPIDYVGKLLSRIGEDDVEFELASSLNFLEVVAKPWDELSRKRFHRLRKQYADKTDILAYAGLGHAPAFE